MRRPRCTPAAPTLCLALALGSIPLGACGSGDADDGEANFAALWGTGVADDLLGQLRDTVTSVATTDVPLLFAPMSLDWQQISDLKDLLRAECPSVNNADFRTRPEAHPICR